MSWSSFVGDLYCCEVVFEVEADHVVVESEWGFLFALCFVVAYAAE